MLTKHKWWGFIPILLLSFLLWATQFDEAFIKQHENNTAYMTIAGQNYLRFGYLEHGLATIMHTDPTISEPTRFYLNHPPLGGILASFSLSLIGIAEVSSRIIPVFLTMIGMSAFGLWVRRAWGYAVAIIALALFAGFPMIAYYGQMLNHEPLILAFALMLLPLFDRYSYDAKPYHLPLIGVLIALMVLSGWQALFFSGAFGIYALYSRAWKLAFIIAISSFSAILLWTIPLIALMPNFTTDLYNQFLFRSGIREQLWANPLEYIWQIAWARWRPRYTESAVLLAPAGFILLFTLYRREHQRMLLAVLLMIPAFLQVFVFQQQTFTHDYTLYYFAPSIALFSAIALDWLRIQTVHSHRLSRFVYGGLLGMLVFVFVLSSFRWTSILYTVTDTTPIDLSSVILEQTEPGEMIYSNYSGWITAAWYYSQRDFQPLEFAPASGYVALMCSPESNSDENTFRAGNQYCWFERH